MFDTRSEEFMAELIKFRHEVIENTKGKETGSDFMVIAKDARKHTLKQVYDWGCERCPHSIQDDSGYGWTHKHQCDDCWQELQKETENGHKI